MAGLTVIVPCCNEEQVIGDCLESVRWADEILVVDSGSTDRTLEIASAYTDRILQHEYINSAAQKNWAIPQASHAWVLIVDSDERVSANLSKEIKQIISSSPDRDGSWVRRENYVFGQRIRYTSWGKDRVLRLFRRDLGRYQTKRVHAEVMLENTGELQAPLLHLAVSSLERWAEKINRYSTWKAEDKAQRGFGLPLVQVLCRPACRFFKEYVLCLGFLDGWGGFLVSCMSAYAEFLMAAKAKCLMERAGKRAEEPLKG